MRQDPDNDQVEPSQPSMIRLVSFFPLSGVAEGHNR